MGDYMTPRGLSHGYYCKNCGKTTNMYGTGHFSMKDFTFSCTPDPDYVKILDDLNK